MVIEISDSIIALELWDLEALRKWCSHNLAIKRWLITELIIRCQGEIVNHIDLLVQLEFSLYPKISIDRDLQQL